jgi:hypothetical protein
MFSGLAALPWSLTIGPLALYIGIKITKTGRYYWAVKTGWILIVTGFSHYFMFRENTPIPVWGSILFITGVGLAFVIPGLSYASQATASKEDLPLVAGLYTFFRTLGQAIGVAISGSTFQNFLKKELQRYPDLAPQAANISKNAVGLIPTIRAMPASSTMREDIITSYVGGLSKMWLVNIPFVAVGLIVCYLHIQDLVIPAFDDVDQIANEEEESINVVEKGVMN